MTHVVELSLVETLAAVSSNTNSVLQKLVIRTETTPDSPSLLGVLVQTGWYWGRSVSLVNSRFWTVVRWKRV